MGKCECGHEACFHRRIDKVGALQGFFARGEEPVKNCTAKDCTCVRFTKVAAE